MYNKKLVWDLYSSADMFSLEKFEITNHMLGVSSVGGLIARKLNGAGLTLDVELVETAGALHDIGKSFNKGAGHTLAGVKFLRWHRVDEKIVDIVWRHEVYSFPAEKAPPDPETWEQKLVFLADLSFSGEILPVKVRVEDIIKRHSGVIREDWLRYNSQKIYKEILGIIQQPLPF